MDTPFVIEQVYDAPIQKVWQALTDENSMRKWYFPASVFYLLLIINILLFCVAM
jgi:uncharacterized protein YndB with AHSA1/START domain